MSVLVGKVKDAHGIKGEIFVKIFSGDTSWLGQLDSVHLKSTGDNSSEQKYQILRARPHKDGIVFQLQEITDRNHAEALKGYEFYIPEELLVAKTGEAIYLREILGFTVVDKKFGPMGKIEGFSSNGAQDLLVIGHGKDEKLIPFVRDFVLEMNFSAKEIIMDLPEGL